MKEIQEKRSEQRKNQRRVKPRLFFWGMMGIVIFVAGILLFPLLLNNGVDIALEPEPMIEEPIDLKISCVGDVMVHKPQLKAQYNSQTDSYDFTNNFEYVKKYIEQADLALCNVETTFRGKPYSGYPVFSAPESLAVALKNAGFDVAITANNHMMDTGFSGMQRTLEVLRNAGFVTAGSRNQGEDSYALKEAKGVKFAIMAYTYETPSNAGRTTINGNVIREEAEPLFNHFNYNTLDEDLQKLSNDIQQARSEGAEIVICYLHWGEEYQRSPNEWQQHIARTVVDMGADIIFASHPHVLQGMELIENQTTGKKVPVFYSMGNFISNQRAETLNNRYTEQGMIATVNLSYMKSTAQILTISQEVMPTWVDKYRSGGKDVYTIVPLDENLENNSSLVVSGHVNRAKQALTDINELLAD